MNILAILLILACACAGLSGACLGSFMIQKYKLTQAQKKIQERYLGHSREEKTQQNKKQNQLPEKVISFIQKQSTLIRLKPQALYATQGFLLAGSSRFDQCFAQTGLGSSVSFFGFCHARALLCVTIAIAAALVGAVLSTELMCIGAVLGALLGWKMPIWALKKRVESRKQNLEDHLSELLEVVSLGLRSGLAFDQSFALYHSHFSTDLAKEAASVQRQWQLGLKAREDALRDFAQSYNSALFTRVIENIIRSLRFGTSLLESFDSAAMEARLIHKAHREEEVAKAPVKMLIPTAALILPAMLLLVLGPILLDMMQGF